MVSKKQNNDTNLENLRQLLKSTDFASLDDNIKDMVLDSLENLITGKTKKEYCNIEPSRRSEQ